MLSFRWFRCTDVHCDCRVTPPARMWPVIPSIHELASTAVVSAVYRELGPAPGLTSADERRLVDEVVQRLSGALEGDLVQGCPWQHGREALADWRVRDLAPPATLADHPSMARAA